MRWFYAGPLDPSTVPQLFSDPTSPTTTVTFPFAGPYLLGVDVSDSRLSTRDFVEVTVHPANAAPVVSAGAYQAIMLPAAAVLDGTVTDDGLPVPPGLTTASWSLVSGPGPVTFLDSTEVDTQASFVTPGSYLLVLTASDGALSAADSVAITVAPANTAPVVNAGADQTIELPAAAVLDGTVSDDGLPNPPGLTTASWSVASGPGPVTFLDSTAVDTQASFVTHEEPDAVPGEEDQTGVEGQDVPRRLVRDRAVSRRRQDGEVEDETDEAGAAVLARVVPERGDASRRGEKEEVALAPGRAAGGPGPGQRPEVIVPGMGVEAGLPSLAGIVAEGPERVGEPPGILEK